MYPALKTDLKKLQHNAAFLKAQCADYGIDIMAVTKVYCGHPELAKAMLDAGITILADSRVLNLKRMSGLDAKKVLLRLPLIAEADEVVKYADISLNSEIKTIKALNESAKNQNKIHGVMLMVDLGDLREGVLPQNLTPFTREVLALEHIRIVGLGVNLTCYGGVMPDENNMGELVELAKTLEATFNIQLDWISGGNSSSLYLMKQGGMPKAVNVLRLGESIVLGRETAYGDVIEGTHTDVFTLEAQIVELKEKESLPKGTIGMDAFGNKPSFVDKGKMVRGILGIGKQDVNPSSLIALDERLEIVGASSDHLIVDFSRANGSYEVGDIVSFNVEYGALLNLWTSEYVTKVIKK